MKVNPSMIKKVYQFRSRSTNGAAQYETILYKDGTCSCNCPGWVLYVNRRRKGQNASHDVPRECKHTKMVQGKVPMDPELLMRQEDYVLGSSGRMKAVTTGGSSAVAVLGEEREIDI